MNKLLLLVIVILMLAGCGGGTVSQLTEEQKVNAVINEWEKLVIQKNAVGLANLVYDPVLMLGFGGELEEYTKEDFIGYYTLGFMFVETFNQYEYRNRVIEIETPGLEIWVTATLYSDVSSVFGRDSQETVVLFLLEKFGNNWLVRAYYDESM